MEKTGETIKPFVLRFTVTPFFHITNENKDGMGRPDEKRMVWPAIIGVQNQPRVVLL